MSNTNENQSEIDEVSNSPQPENSISSVSQQDDVQQRSTSNNHNPPTRQRQSPWTIIKSFLFRILMIYLVTRFFRRPTTVHPTENKTLPINPAISNSAYMPGSLYATGDLLDIYIFISEEQVYKYDPMRKPIWILNHFHYGDWTSEGTHIKFNEFSISENVKNNGSIYLHVVVTKHGYSIDPNQRESHSPQYTFWKSKRLNKYKKKVYKKTKNLLTGNTDQDEEYQKKADDNVVELLSHWHSNMTINLLDDQSSWIKGSIPPPLDKYIDFDVYTGKFYPVLFLNDYWNLLADYYPINNTIDKLNLTITVAPIQLWKWQMFISQNMRQSWYGNLFNDEQNDEDQDTLKRALVETNPYLLAMTIIVSLIHTVFEILAFKNDIQFWRTRKSLEGLSVRSVFLSIFQSFIVLLYVFDNETNTMVRISVFVGIIIELWKVPKIVNFEYLPNEKWFGIIPKYKYVYKQSYKDTTTSDYDRMAFRYLSWLLFPLVVGYACYLLMYHEQKSWYSFCLSTIYGFLLTFGFIMMTPQLFINYKLKSVSHLPWRMMTYKALNTFIDDLFAFVIKMPTMYRIGCFRDDIIFFIYLYQRYIYPVDRTRVNEFGTTGETDSSIIPVDHEILGTSQDSNSQIEQSRFNFIRQKLCTIYDNSMLRSLIRPSTCVRCLINRIQYNSTSNNKSEINPGNIFIRKDVQDLLINITGFDLSRIFHLRNNKNLDRIVYKYLTDKQLKEEQEKTIERGRAKLQMPPVLPEATENVEILEKDEMLSGFSSSKHLFMDISLGIPIRDRLIVARDVDGTLRTATLDEKRRMRQIYFPIVGRELIMPKTFEDKNLEKILERGDYEFILDRACTQFEPDDRDYIHVTHKTYEHIDQTNSFDVLRSTRHFGTMAFYFVWFKKIDRLMNDMIRRNLKYRNNN
ncbi:unnamed protein product [Rotaria sp. Silwood2]|nr:unnamed protein product [Rotaria sp. Silwood2]CAF4373080.1 unnamed protein product [Rotaria sp. Silwood2]